MMAPKVSTMTVAMPRWSPVAAKTELHMLKIFLLGMPEAPHAAYTPLQRLKVQVKNPLMQ